MTLEEVKQSLIRSQPPEGLSKALHALWYDAKGDWEKAHQIAQSDDSADCAWVHAFLHRKEGDDSNAGYWYRRAGRPLCQDSLEREWEQIVAALVV